MSYSTDKRMFKEQQATSLKEQIEATVSGEVHKISQKEKRRPRPGGLNTTEMLKFASSSLGMSPHEGLKIAEQLYLSGFTTYPRTESTKYASNFDIDGLVRSIKNKHNSSPDLKSYAEKLLKKGVNKSTKGVDVGDHPPITPTTNVPDHLPAYQARLYDFICRRFLASVSSDAVVVKKKVELKFGDYQFFLEGQSLKEKGFLEIATWEGLVENYIKDYEKGQEARIASSRIKEGVTQPPSLLSESDLISLMEKHGIGTDASIATHINNVCERGYVTVEAGRRLKPTTLGTALYHGYNAVDKELVAPNLRSKIERACDQIAKGERKYKDVLAEIVKVFRDKFENFTKQISKMEAFFSESFVSFDQAQENSKPFTKCGKCNRFMDIIKSFNKIKCETCSDTFDLPKNAKYNKKGNNYCPLDGYQVFSYIIEGKKIFIR